MNSKFSHVKISGVCTVVPSKSISIDDEVDYYADKTKLERLKNTVGIQYRSVVSKETTPADLMEDAAKHILSDMMIDKNSIDAIVCVLDFPDYKIPPTACVLHGKLGLPSSCLSFDITHGCAGYVYGLYVAHSMIENGNCKRVLLLVGDTKSRTINIKDRVSAPLFGDGASATLLEYSEESIFSAFVLGTKGNLYQNIMIPAGGARIPCSEKTREETEDEFGNIRTLEQFKMNGKAVFDFTIETVPQSLKDILSYTGLMPDDINYLVMHQANKSILANIAMRAGFRDMKKVPTATLAKYGNLSVASIPSVFNDQLSEVLRTQKNQLLISGFGVGLAWGCAVLNMNQIYCPQPFVYKEKKSE